MFEKPKTEQDTDDIMNGIKVLTENLAGFNDAFKLMDEEAKLRKDMYEHQIKYPQVLKPNFEFEEDIEYRELLKRQWKLDMDKHLRNMDGLRKDYEGRKAKTEVELKKLQELLTKTEGKVN